MKITIPIVLLLLTLSACETITGSARHLAATPAGSEIVAKAADKVIQKGLNAGATSIDTGNPYLHAVADAIRSNPDGIVDPVNVQKIFVDSGDPDNKAKFKQLGKDLWVVARDSAVRFGKANAAELLAEGVQKGAVSQERTIP